MPSAADIFKIPPKNDGLVDRPHISVRGRVSLLLYAGSSLIAFGGLLYGLALAAVHDGDAPPPFTDYAQAITMVGFAFVLVGFARQAKRMCE